MTAFSFLFPIFGLIIIDLLFKNVKEARHGWLFYFWEKTRVAWLSSETNTNVSLPILQRIGKSRVRLVHVFKPRKSIPYQKLYQFGHWYDIFRILVNTDVLFWIYRYFILYIYTHTHTIKFKKKRKKRGKTINDIVSTTRIMSTKLTFRATLPFQILSTCRKERKKPNTFFILVFSLPLSHIYFILSFFFSTIAHLKLVAYQPIIPISKFQHIIASHAISLQPHITSSSFKLILSSIFTFYLISSPLVTACILPSPSNKGAYWGLAPFLKYTPCRQDGTWPTTSRSC